MDNVNYTLHQLIGLFVKSRAVELHPYFRGTNEADRTVCAAEYRTEIRSRVQNLSPVEFVDFIENMTAELRALYASYNTKLDLTGTVDGIIFEAIGMRLPQEISDIFPDENFQPIAFGDVEYIRLGRLLTHQILHPEAYFER